MIEHNCDTCGKSRADLTCDRARVQHEYCRDWVPRTNNPNQTVSSKESDFSLSAYRMNRDDKPSLFRKETKEESK